MYVKIGAGNCEEKWNVLTGLVALVPQVFHVE
jgi:hypothetical protein